MVKDKLGKELTADEVKYGKQRQGELEGIKEQV